jgi:hypothetical protein
MIGPAVAHVKERPGYREEVAIGRALVGLERTAPGFVASLRRAMKTAEALLLAEHVRRKWTDKAAA